MVGALALAGDHLSLYQLTIEPETLFERMVNAGKMTVPDAETQRALWDVTQDLMNAAGMPAYEVSNHARAGAAHRSTATIDAPASSASRKALTEVPLRNNRTTWSLLCVRRISGPHAADRFLSRSSFGEHNRDSNRRPLLSPARPKKIRMTQKCDSGA